MLKVAVKVSCCQLNIKNIKVLKVSLGFFHLESIGEILE